MGAFATRAFVSALWLSAIVAGSWLSARSNAATVPDKGSVHVRVFDRAGQPVLARIRVAPASWGERARLGQLADVHATSGQDGVELALAGGDYELFATRGPEWSLGRKRLRVAPGAALDVRLELAHQAALPGFRAADLHVHTAHSPDAKHGGVTAQTLLAEGLELAVATDHNAISDLGDGIDSIAGAEITTWAPEVGHFNAFPLQRIPTWRGTHPRRLVEELSSDPNVFIQINHPRLEDHIGYFALGGFDGRGFARDDFHLDVHGLEVWNGYDIGRPDQVRRLLAEWRGIVARGRRLTATGGSNCHGATGHHPGYPRTYVRADSADELVPALKAGRAFVTNGPLLVLRVQGKVPGETVRASADGKVEIELEVHAPDYLRVEQAEIWAGDRLVWQARIRDATPGQPLRFSASTRIALRRARTVHAVVHGGSGLELLLGRAGVEPLAFTNPVFVARTPEAVAQK